MNGIAQIINVAVINGKSVDFRKDRFCLQNVRSLTDLVYIDDADRNFNLEQLFSTLSGGMEIEQKYKDKLLIAFKDSPKFAITTNYAIKGVSSSHKRRKHDVFVNSNYDHRHSPYDDFGREFFHEWDEQEWQRFDNYMLHCVQKYLRHGLIAYETEEMKEKMLINQTSPEFWQAMSDGYGIREIPHKKGALREAIAMQNDAYRNLSFKKLKEWINMYAEHLKLDVEHSERASDGYTYVLKAIEREKKTPEEEFIQEGEEKVLF